MPLPNILKKTEKGPSKEEFTAGVQFSVAKVSSLSDLPDKNTSDASDAPASLEPPVRELYADAQPRRKSRLHIFLGVAVAALVFLGALYLYLNKKSPIAFISPLVQEPKDTFGKIINAKSVTNPLTGVQYTEQEASTWKDIRPLAVMVNNHVDARPQSGLVYADLVYEIVAEGGITRYIAFFLTNTPTKLGPVRSTREYYLVLVKELGDAMLMHIGYSPQALEAIETWPVRSLGRANAPFWRDNPRNVAIEHTAYADGTVLRQVGLDVGWEGTRAFDVWKFKDDKKGYGDAPPATDLSIDFWFKGDYSANWKYNASDNTYLRYVGYDDQDKPIPHVDQETKEQIAVKNVIVQFATEVSIPNDDKHRLDYTLVGSGQGLVFLDGKVVKATWSKTERDGRTMFYDLDGKEIQFNRGKFWVAIVPDRNVDQVVYTTSEQ